MGAPGTLRSRMASKTAARVPGRRFAGDIGDRPDGAQDAALARLQINAREWAASKLRQNRGGARIAKGISIKDGPIVARSGSFLIDLVTNDPDLAGAWLSKLVP